MDELLDQLERLVGPEAWADSPSGEAWLSAMDPLAWIMLAVTLAALVLGAGLQVMRIRSAAGADPSEEAMPGTLLDRLKRNPTYMAPATVLQQLGAELTLELLVFGDGVPDMAWVQRWTPVREELLRQMSMQQAFAPLRALVSYYQCQDVSEPASIRIRRTALIHKLGRRRYVPPGPDGSSARLLVFTDGVEPVGELGFLGRIHWLRPEHRPRLEDGPMVELDPISFHGLDRASLQIRIYRSLLTGAGFRLHFSRVGEDWIVDREELDWAR